MRRESSSDVPSQAADLRVDDGPQQSPYTSQSALHLHRPPSLSISYARHSPPQERQLGSSSSSVVTFPRVAAEEDRREGEVSKTIVKSRDIFIFNW